MGGGGGGKRFDLICYACKILHINGEKMGACKILHIMIGGERKK